MEFGLCRSWSNIYSTAPYICPNGVFAYECAMQSVKMKINAHLQEGQRGDSHRKLPKAFSMVSCVTLENDRPNALLSNTHHTSLAHMGLDSVTNRMHSLRL